MASSTAIAPSAALPNSRASSGPQIRKPDPMTDASGVTVARQPSLRANLPNVSAIDNKDGDDQCDGDDHAVPPSQALLSRRRRL